MLTRLRTTSVTPWLCESRIRPGFQGGFTHTTLNHQNWGTWEIFQPSEQFLSRGRHSGKRRAKDPTRHDSAPVPAGRRKGKRKSKAFRLCAQHWHCCRGRSGEISGSANCSERSRDTFFGQALLRLHVEDEPLRKMGVQSHDMLYDMSERLRTQQLW